MERGGGEQCRVSLFSEHSARTNSSISRNERPRSWCARGLEVATIVRIEPPDEGAVIRWEWDLSQTFTLIRLRFSRVVASQAGAGRGGKRRGWWGGSGWGEWEARRQSGCRTHPWLLTMAGAGGGGKQGAGGRTQGTGAKVFDLLTGERVCLHVCVHICFMHEYICM